MVSGLDRVDCVCGSVSADLKEGFQSLTLGIAVDTKVGVGRGGEEERRW
jgi:hypothetical protein